MAAASTYTKPELLLTTTVAPMHVKTTKELTLLEGAVEGPVSTMTEKTRSSLQEVQTESLIVVAPIGSTSETEDSTTATPTSVNQQARVFFATRTHSTTGPSAHPEGVA